jgi:integrase/recombinase XerD
MDKGNADAVQLPEVIGQRSQNLTKSPGRVKEELPEYWEREYIGERLNHVTDARARMLITFLWRSGVRITEAVSLRKQDLDFLNYVMKVRWLKSRKYLHRMVPLHPSLRDLLQVYTAGMKSEELVFPLSRQRAWQITQRWLGGNPHKLRHSFAVNWLRSGGEIVTLSRILGHSDIKVTMVYLRIVPVDQGKELLKVRFD